MKYKLISSATLPGKTQVAEKILSEEKIRLTFFSVLVFIAGFASKQVINLVGELYLVELLLPLLAFMVLLSGKSSISSEKIFWKFVVLCVFLIIGYMISDLVAGTDSTKYLRAWGRNFILLSNIVSLAIIFSSDRQLIWWFVLGLAVSALIGLVLGNTSLADWKMGYGKSVILIAILSGYFFPKRIVMIGLLGIGVLSISLDSRSLGALSLITSGIIFLRIKKPEGLRLSASAILRIIVAAGLVLSTLLYVLNLTQDEFGDRRSSSNVGRFAALQISIEAIGDSPLLGYGSWGEGTEKYAHKLYKETEDEVRASGKSNYVESEVFLSHSQILQSWMEGGVFAAMFFIYFGWQAFIGLRNIVLTRSLDYLTPLYSLFLLSSGWHLLMSPFSGGHRLQIALSISIICLLHLEKKEKRVG